MNEPMIRVGDGEMTWFWEFEYNEDCRFIAPYIAPTPSLESQEKADIARRRFERMFFGKPQDGDKENA